MMGDRPRPKDGGSAPSDEERRLFEAEMRDVRRLDRSVARVAEKEKPAPRPLADAAEEPSGAGLVTEAAGEHVAAFDPSVPAAARRALRRYGTRPQAVLDLHGLVAAEAARRVESFVREARAAGRRHALIVTGRGLRSGPAGPVLRREVVRLLTEGALRRAVLGLVTAPPALGGPGALLLLLRRA